MITVSGTLTDTFGQRLKFCEVMLQALSNEGEIVNSANKSFRTDSNGFYSEHIPYGKYRVLIRSRDSRTFYLVKNEIVVDNSTANQPLNDLIV